MTTAYQLPIDDLEDKLRTATREILKERKLSDRVLIEDIQRQVDSSRIDVDLAERTGPKETKFHRFAVQPEEALEAQHGAAITVESLKPFVSRDLEKLFPE